MATELPDVEVLDVFVIDEDGRLRVPPAPSSEPSDPAAVGGSAVRHLQEVRATPGHRLGNDPGHLVRTGLAEEVSQPLPIRADVVLAWLRDGSVLENLPALLVDHGSRQEQGSTASWTTRLATGAPSGHRAAVLRIRPTPSRNVTMIELVPVHPRRYRTKTFVRLGVAAVAEVDRRLRVRSPASGLLSHPRANR